MEGRQQPKDSPSGGGGDRGAFSATSSPAMPAPTIPNLLSRLGSGPPRAGRGGRRGLGRGGPLHGSHHGHRGGGGGSGHGHGAAPAPMDHNAVIQGTDTDAALSRLSAVDIGLLQDPFAKFFAGNGGPAPRRLPIINRGTYTRTQALDTIIRSFLADTPSSAPQDAATPVRQIVSLGAGTDTRSLRLLSQQAPALHNVVYHEIDFAAVATRKRNIVQSVPYLRSVLSDPVITHQPEDVDATTTTPEHWHAELGRGNSLWSHGLDLRRIVSAAADAAADKLALAGLRADAPTLVVSECCLCYLQPAEAAAVLRWFADRLAGAAALGMVVYEPIRPDDPFGRTMVANLAARHIAMPTLTAYPDGAAQEARLRREAGLAQAQHRTIEGIWDAWVPAAEKERVNQLDGLDEEEEWQLLASHYVVVWGSRGEAFASAWAKLYDS